jgi:hypothetical protein
LAGKPVHSAAQSAVGYLYQARLGLAECLRYAYIDSGIDIAIEKLDDVSFEKDGSPLELLQTKHHLKKQADLTDASVDLWKTLRVWAEAIRADPSLPGRTRFALVTTAQAPDGSAASYLRPAGGAAVREPAMADALLMSAAAASKNVALEKAIAAFTGLASAMRQALVASIEVMDGVPLIADLEIVIEERLRMIAPRGKTAIAREQLEGWWWPRICASLQAKTPGTISVLEVEQKLDDIRDGLKRDALPFDMEHAASGLRKLALLGSNPGAGGLGFRDVPGAFPHMPAPRERLQRLLASCPVAMRVRAAAFVLLPIGQSPTPRCSRRCRLGQSDVTNDLVPSEHPVLVSDWAGALEQKVGQTTTLRLLS